MNRRDFLRNTGLLAAGLAAAALSRANVFALDDLPQDGQGRRIAEGVVFEDRNGSGARGRNPGIAGVRVSNGREVVKTDAQGRWRLPVDEDSILFVVKPAGWMTPTDQDGLPRYYYIHKPKGSPESKYPGVPPTGPLPTSIDFPLKKQRENDRFTMVLFGDTQPRDQKEIDFMAHDVIENVVRDIAASDARFGLTLGDEMFDDLSLYPSLNRTIGTLGLPWYNTVGNHDMNYDAVDDASATETFEATYGPPYYAFDYAKVHFIVLDNVVWHGSAAQGAERGYHAEIGARQLEFVRNDLAHVPKDRLVVVAMHIPIGQVRDREALYRLLEGRAHTFSLSAHTHVQEHAFLAAADGWRGATPHHHLNHATVCGSWWRGAPDERGIPHATMSDGGPNGYSLIEFDGTRYKVTFRPASRPADEQMSLWLPETLASSETGAAEIVVNVFAGSSRSRVEMRVGENGAWVPMTHSPREDPYYMKLKEIEAAPTPPPGRKLPEASKADHIWTARLPAGMPAGTHPIEVRTTDMFGATYADRRIVRVS